MFGAFYNGINGIKSQSFGIDITANNIANVSTPGFKYSQAEFADIFYSTVSSSSTNPSQSGHGSMPNASKLVFEQGSFADAESEFSVGLNGKGFFGVMGGDSVYYTRNGDFLRDANGNLVDTSGNYVLGTMNPNFAATIYSDRVASLMGANLDTTPITSGWTINNPSESFSIGTSNNQTILQVPKNLYLAPEVTTEVTFKGSLNSDTRTENKKIEFDTNSVTISQDNDDKFIFSGRVGQDQIYSAKEGDIVILTITDANGVKQSVQTELDANLNFTSNAFDLAGLDPDSISVESAVLSTQQQTADNKILEAALYNSDGSVGSVRYTLQRILPQVGDTMEFSVTAQVYDSEKNPVGEQSTGTMTFNQYGALLSNTLTSVPNPNGGTISANFGTPLSDQVGSGYDGIYINTRDDREDSISSSSNGFAEGFFSQYDITNDGSLVAEFTNGRTAVVGKLALYNFINEEGLYSVGGNNFQATSNSGPASFIYDDNGNFAYTASFVSKKLEQSNVSLADELTNLIVMQKAFDASSKSITTSDEMIQRAINMKD